MARTKDVRSVVPETSALIRAQHFLAWAYKMLRSPMAGPSRLVRLSTRAIHASHPRREAIQLESRLRDALKSAMKSRDRPTTEVIKVSQPSCLLLPSSTLSHWFLEAGTDGQTTLSQITYSLKNASSSPDPNSIALKVLRQSIRERSHAAAAYVSSAGVSNQPLHDELKNEERILRMFLPETPSTEEMERVVRDVVGGLAEKNPKETGRVMGEVMGRLGVEEGLVDRKELGGIIARALR